MGVKGIVGLVVEVAMPLVVLGVAGEVAAKCAVFKLFACAGGCRD
jgi:hypothetical protein